MRVGITSLGSSRSILKGEHRNHPVTVSVSCTFEKTISFLYRISTADIISDGGDDAGLREKVEACSKTGRGKEREKKPRGPPLGNAEMSLETRGEAVDGQVEWHTRDHNCRREERWWRVAEEQLMEARLGPSRLVRMWESMMSVCNAEKSVLLLETTSSSSVAAGPGVVGGEAFEVGFIWLRPVLLRTSPVILKV